MQKISDLDSASKGQTPRLFSQVQMAVTDVNSTAVQGSLTDTLVKKLSISNEQAQGGAGALFQLAKSNLDAGQFAALSKAVPEMDSLLSKAPKQLVAWLEAHHLPWVKPITLMVILPDWLQRLRC